ncbi:hypothetical protein Pla86_12650 [Planctomycetes bacterium Pla86]|uniref:Uncharacterized protein n=2 Tax=Engelhardtia mirabilis TaxID=2528011 RepID=A0A518BGT4_9BACT|nr:hypothetical protein Pla133_12650 [Planctomycetes bacterium Pla133]QDV00526.1 hypothetical protein Pla86_12650 [Planctomycetes bacterium Pla86]
MDSWGVRVEDANQILVCRGVDDPLDFSDHAFVRIDVDERGGLGETVLCRQGHLLPGQAEIVNDVKFSPAANAFDEGGEVHLPVDREGSSADAPLPELGPIGQPHAPSPGLLRHWYDLGRDKVALIVVTTPSATEGSTS